MAGGGSSIGRFFAWFFFILFLLWFITGPFFSIIHRLATKEKFAIEGKDFTPLPFVTWMKESFSSEGEAKRKAERGCTDDPKCPEEGKTFCDGNTIMECQEDSKGCFQPILYTQCDAGDKCEIKEGDAECVKSGASAVSTGTAPGAGTAGGTSAPGSGTPPAPTGKESLWSSGWLWGIIGGVVLLGVVAAFVWPGFLRKRGVMPEPRKPGGM